MIVINGVARADLSHPEDTLVQQGVHDIEGQVYGLDLVPTVQGQSVVDLVRGPEVFLEVHYHSSHHLRHQYQRHLLDHQRALHQNHHPFHSMYLERSTKGLFTMMLTWQLTTLTGTMDIWLCPFKRCIQTISQNK